MDMTRAQLNIERYDLVILGTGAGAKVSAWVLASEGKRVAVVERKYIGGACPNIACMPSKNIIHTAQIASYAHRLKEFGLSANSLALNMRVVRERKRRMVAAQVEEHLNRFHETGAELILGSGRFIGPCLIEVLTHDGAKRVLHGDKVLIGTGSRAYIDGTPGLREASPMTHTEALELDVVPEHLVVLGGGYVGLEFAQAMRRFGSRVTIIHNSDRVLKQEDSDVSEAVHALLADEGVDVLLNSTLMSVSGESGKSVSLALAREGRQQTITATHLLVTTGRTPNTDELGLETTGVETTADGYIRVNDRLETTAANIWAVGDVAGSPKFTHVSEDDFRVFHSGLTQGNATTTGRLVPYCLFLDPELARVGINETEARARGIAYRVFKTPMASVLRAQSIMETRGFLKALVAKDSDNILGFTAFGTGAGEVMATVQIAMLGNVPYTVLRDAILAHPTMSEGLHPLFLSAPTLVHTAHSPSA